MHEMLSQGFFNAGPSLGQRLLFPAKADKSGEAHIIRSLWYERVYLSLLKVADTPFHIYGSDM